MMEINPRCPIRPLRLPLWVIATGDLDPEPQG